jgi:hypothetical protein
LKAFAKAKVEQGVLLAERWILAALRATKRVPASRSTSRIVSRNASPTRRPLA